MKTLQETNYKFVKENFGMAKSYSYVLWEIKKDKTCYVSMCSNQYKEIVYAIDFYKKYNKNQKFILQDFVKKEFVVF